MGLRLEDVLLRLELIHGEGEEEAEMPLAPASTQRPSTPTRSGARPPDKRGRLDAAAPCTATSLAWPCYPRMVARAPHQHGTATSGHLRGLARVPPGHGGLPREAASRGARLGSP